jgi:hypothetical protein
MADKKATLNAVSKILTAANKASLKDGTNTIVIAKPEERQTGFCVEVSASSPLEVSKFTRLIPGARVFARGDICPVTLDVYFEPSTLMNASDDGTTKKRRFVPGWFVGCAWAAFAACFVYNSYICK